MPDDDMQEFSDEEIDEILRQVFEEYRQEIEEGMERSRKKLAPLFNLRKWNLALWHPEESEE